MSEARRDAVSSFSAGTRGATADSSSVFASRSCVRNAGSQLARVRRVGLGEPVVGEDQRAQLVLVERVRGLEQRGRLRVERLGAGDDVVEGVADRDDVVDGERVPSVDEHLLHHLQRGALPLHDAGQVAQRGHQRRRERVGEAERLLVRAAVLVVGVDPVEQHVPDGGAAVDPRERVPQHQLGLGIVGPLAQQAPVRHVGQVVVAEHDRAEPALLVPERAVQRLLLGAACPGVGEPAAQVHLPGDERHERDRPRPHARLDQLGELLRLAAEELAVLHRERQPQHELVEEQHHGVVAEALGVLGDDGQAGVEVDELRLPRVGREVLPGKRRDELLPQLGAWRGGLGGGVGVRRPGHVVAEQPGPLVGRLLAAPPFSPAKNPSSPMRARIRSASARSASDM